jgi:DNA helicase HerA-like ATPase
VIRNHIGEVYSSSTEEYIHLRLNEDQILEDFQLGDYLTIFGVRKKYLCKLIKLTSKQLISGLAETSVALRQIEDNGLLIGDESPRLSGSPIFYDLILKPLKTISLTESDDPRIHEPKISEPQTIPPVFTRVKRTVKDDLDVFFTDREGKKYVTIGYIRGTMGEEAAESKVELFRMQNLHAAIFAKTGSGKTVLAKILVGHIAAEENSCALVFDMHDEYGYKTKGTSGLKPYFNEKVYVMSVDPKKTEVDAHVVVPWEDIRVHDVKVALPLSVAQESAMYTLAEAYGKDWISVLQDKDRADEILLDTGGIQNEKGKVTGGEIKRVTLNTLRREVRNRITNLKCFEEKVKTSAVDTIVNMILSGRTVIINFGDYSDDPMVYALTTNLISRRVFEVYKRRISDKSDSILRQVSILIEEAHKFLNKANIQSAFFGRFIREARKFKMGLIIVDQRPSKIDEEVLSQIGTLFVMQLTNAKDLRILTEETEEGVAEYVPEIKRLNRREGLVVGQGSDFVQNFKIFDYTNQELLERFWGIDKSKRKKSTRFD